MPPPPRCGPACNRLDSSGIPPPCSRRRRGLPPLGVRPMDLRDFHYFLSVAETGSFSKAAMVHNIAQSALCRRIRDL